MSNFEWDEKELETLLEQLPKYEDSRPKQQLFNELKRQGLFEEEVKVVPSASRKKRYRRYVASTTIAVLAAAASVFIIPSLLKDTTPLQEQPTLEMQVNNDGFGVNNIESNEKDLVTKEASVSRTADLRTGLYVNEIGNEHVFYVGVPTDEQHYISYATKIPSEWMQQNELQAASYVDLYKEVAPLLNEIGIDDSYHPLKGELVEEGQTLIHILPSDSSFETVFDKAYYEGIMQATFGQHYTHLQVVYQDGTEQIVSLQNKAETIVIPTFLTDDITEYVVSPAQSFETIEEAISDYLQRLSLISQMPNYVPLELKQENTILHVTFKSELHVTEYVPGHLMAILEGIIYTAANYGYIVQFNGVDTDYWGGFDLTQPIEPPLAPNEFLFPS